ncbi:MAG TPA: two-component regulator propeller domain-containing protein [Gemmatimonadaceae bacterium]
MTPLIDNHAAHRAGPHRGRWLIPLSLGVALGLVRPGAAVAQVLNFRHYTNSEGLPQAQVLAMQQDHLGYMWFATYGGLTRFNGADFRTYTTDDGLTSNSVFDVKEDSKGRLFIGTSRGLCIMTRERFHCYRERDGLVYDDARSIAIDPNGDVWVGTTRGLSHVSRHETRNFTTADGLPDERIVRVAVDSTGRVWVATSHGLARLDGDRFRLDSPDVIGARSIQFVVPAGRGVLVGVAGGRLYRREGDTIVPVTADGIPDGTVFVDAATARDGTIWVATLDGALRIRDGRADRIGRKNGLLADLVIRVAIDREDDVWFGTENGASKMVPGPFRTYTESEGLPSPFVRAIAADAEGRLWVGTRNGVAVREGERFRPIPLPGVPDSRVYGLAIAPEGGMLIGTRRGLAWYAPGRVRLYREPDGLPGEVVYALLPDGAGGVWIGTDRGLARWKAGRITAVDRTPLKGTSIMSLARDSRGRLWMGRTAGGIAVLEGDSVRVLNSTNGATDQTVWALREDALGRMWAATNGDGALRIEDSGIRRLTVRDGLASSFIWQVLSDAAGDIWLFGNLGMDRFSKDELTHFGQGSGLIELEGAANSAFMDAERDLWFGTGSGVVRYTPGLDLHRALPLPVYIEELSQGDSTLSVDSGRPTRVAGGSMFIRFASPSFRDESSIRYRYRLSGADTGWSRPSRERSVTYAGLAPGHYRFEVVATSGAARSLTPATLAFDVMPAFWQTWWFRLLALLLLGAAAAAVPLLRARALERERQRLEGLVAHHTHELESKNILLEQSNRDLEHFAYVASHDLQEPLRKIQSFSDRVLKQYAGALDEQGRDYLGRMSGAAARMQNLIEALLSLSRVSTKKGEVAQIDLRALTQEVLGDLEFRLQSTCGRVDVGDLPCIEGDPVQMRQLLQNLIGNALKFHRPGEPPVVTVSAARRDRQLEIRVEDNGIGFENKDAARVFLPFHRLHGRAEYEGTGIGLTICRKIVQRHDGTIRAESQPGSGSRFIITLPLHRLVEVTNAA